MDWTSIINTIIVSIFAGGGLFGGIHKLALVSAERRKQEQENLNVFIDNTAKLIDQWQEIAEERKHRCGELKADLDKKDAKIDEQYKTISILRNELDFERTGHAVAEVLKCDKTECTERHPPYGQGLTYCRLAKIPEKTK